MLSSFASSMFVYFSTCPAVNITLLKLEITSISSDNKHDEQQHSRRVNVLGQQVALQKAHLYCDHV